MKTKLLFLAFLLFIGSLHINAQITLSHHVDPDLVDVVGLACGSGSGNTYFNNQFARVYNLNEFDITEDFLITDVEFGQGFGDDGKTVFIKIYTSDVESLTAASLTLVSTTETSILSSDNFSIVSVPIEPVNIPAGSIIVVETFAPEHATLNYNPGFNLSGHTGTAWVRVPNCGIPIWSDANSLQSTTQHLLINLVGSEVVGVEENFAENTSIFPNPSAGVFTINLANTYDAVDVTVTNSIGQQISYSRTRNSDMIELMIEGAVGVYFVNITTSAGNSTTMKVIKKG